MKPTLTHRVLMCLLLVLGFCHTAAAEEQTPPQGAHLFILSGQSNMRSPLPETFRHCVEQVFGKDRAIVTMRNQPSQPIKRWYKAWTPPAGMDDPDPETNGQIYDTLIAQVNKAIAGKQIATVTYVWMQGEADADKSWGSVYEKSFMGVIDQLRTDLGRDDIHFVVGRINEFWLDEPDGELVRSVLQKLGEDNANGDWIDTDDLNHGVNPWGGYSFEDGHFPPAGYRVMGQRFAKKACLLIDPQMELDPNIFKEVFFDSADHVKTHAAVGREVTGAAPDQGAKGWGRDLRVLADGRFAKPDPGANGWVGFAPSEEAVEMVVDLGEVRPIAGVAVNVLVGKDIEAGFPARVVYTFSKDGETYFQHNSRHNSINVYNARKYNERLEQGTEPQALLLLADQYNKRGVLEARYVKVGITPGKQAVYLDEIVVDPVAKEQ